MTLLAVLHFPLLSSLVILPIIFAIGVALIPKDQVIVIKALAGVASLIELFLGLMLLLIFKTNHGGFQFVSLHSWISSFGISWYLGVDGISLFLVLLSIILFPIAILAPRSSREPKSFMAWMLVLEGASIGSFLSLDLFLFFAFFELTLVPTYFIISGWGHQKRNYASYKFFLYTFLGSAFLLVGILALVVLHQSATGVLTFNLLKLASRQTFTTTTGIFLFLAFTIAFAIKTPIVPFHTWSPDAYGEAPAGGSLILAGILAKLGTYGMIRFDLTLFPTASIKLAPILATLGVIGIIYGALVASAQKDLKRLIAYSSVAHLGFIVLGIFAFSAISVSGGVLQMVNHGIITAGLFLLIAMIYERRGTHLIEDLKGLQKPAPVLAAIFTLVMFSAFAVPGLNGFTGEFLILLGAFPTMGIWVVFATAGVILAALYMLWAYQRTFHGPAEGANAHIFDLNTKERLLMVPFVILIVFIGVFPQPLLSRIDPSVRQLVHHVEQHMTKTSPSQLASAKAGK